MTYYTTAQREFRILDHYSMSSERATHNFCTNLCFYDILMLYNLKKGQNISFRGKISGPNRYITHRYSIYIPQKYRFLQNCARPAPRACSKVVRFDIPVPQRHHYILFFAFIDLFDKNRCLKWAEQVCISPNTLPKSHISKITPDKSPNFARSSNEISS